MIPSIGRIVHYVSYGTPGGEYTSQCRAAVVTEVSGNPSTDFTVGLCALNPTGMFFNRNVPRDEDHKVGGTWHAPEHVDGG